MVLCIGGEATQQNGPIIWLYAGFSFSPSQESHWQSGDVLGDDRICSTQQQF
jgi:hypothetical protein